MTVHALDAIADAIVELIIDAGTAAETRVERDREPPLDARGELPAVVVHIGEDDPVDDQVHGRWRSTARINVDLYVKAPERQVSATVLALRAETYAAIMADHTLGVASVVSTLPGGAEEILRSEGSITIGYCRTAFFVTYQHQFDDPTEGP